MPLRASALNLVIDSVSRRLRIGRAGAVALVTALCAPILVMIVGFVVDFSYASYINQRLARATDAATLGAVSQTAGTAAGGYGNLSLLQTMGTNYFNANTTQLGVTGINFSLSVTSDNNGGVIATGLYNGNVPTFFAGALGISNIPVSGSAKTTARPLTYVNYYILVDNSQSMGIGATQADMTALYQRVLANNNAAATDGGCVFGCHVKGRQVGQPGGHQPVTNEDLAHNLTKNWGAPITLRIDSAVTAVTSIVQSAATIAATTKNIKFGLYTLEVDPTTGRKIQVIKNPAASNPPVAADFLPSSDYSSVQTAVSTIGLGNTLPDSNTGDTNFHDEFAAFLSGFSPPLIQGSGASSTSPLNYIFLITDGLNDVPGNCNIYQLCASPLNSSDCTSLKAIANVGVIYTTYLPIYAFNTAPLLENRFGTIVGANTPSLVRTALQNCATSSDLYFEAQDGPSLISSMQTLFQRTQPVSARISQ